MCGIVGYVGPRRAQNVLLEGLEKLEYRGYDSAGISVLCEDEVETVRSVGNLRALRAAIAAREPRTARVLPNSRVETLSISTGVGHTRWATHGRVSEANAHPHADTSGRLLVVLNGIVENYLPLRRALEAEGCVFRSETDAEAVVQLIGALYAGDLEAATRSALAELRGHYAIVAMSVEEPGLLVAARQECPLVIGRGDGEQFVASAIPAFLAHTRRVQHLEDGELAVIRSDDVEVTGSSGRPRARGVVEIGWDQQTADRDGYETFMLKEIHEQAEAVRATLAGRLRAGSAAFSDACGIDEELLRGTRRVVVVGCGTSYHAGLIGRYAIERWARVPVEVEVASEYRYRTPVVGPGDLVVAISQSGETADTLAAMRLARSEGATVLAVTNVAGSQMTRNADGVLFTRAGLEVGVAATKTFASQVVSLYLLALRLSEMRDALPAAELDRLSAELEQLPDQLLRAVASTGEPAEMLAQEHLVSDFFLYFGRDVGLPVALEGALKLKEISYIPTDAYAAGEMKHGPIALIGEGTPVVCVATNSSVLEKLISNIEEVRARGARVLAVATEGNTEVSQHADHTIFVPETDPMLQPVVAIVPLQLLAYHIARGRGLNVDQPRNLAKTVTVE